MTKAPLPNDRKFARMLCEGVDDAAGGILTATRGRLRRLFCLQQGSIIFATSNLIEEQFVEYLVRTDAISPQVYSEAVEQAGKTKTKPLAHLIRNGTPAREALERAMEGLIREILSSTLEWPDGQCTFDAGRPRLDGEITVRLSPRPLILAHAKRHPASLDALRVRIGPPDFRPIAVDSSEFLLRPSDAVGDFLLARCDGTVDLSQLLKESPADEETTLRAIYGFLLAGLLEPEDRQARRDRESKKKEDELSREECLGRLTLAAGQDHYGVLGVDRTARPKAIVDAYYSLARRYHPDRFRSGSLTDLLSRFEEYFRMVTDAHNTLSDPTSRAEYDAQLASKSATAEAKGADPGYLAKQNFLRGRALAAQRKFTEAVTFFENALTLDPGQPEYHLELGLVLSRNPRHREEAERRLLQAIDLAPTAVSAYVALGQMYLKAGRLGRAGRMAREALRWEPDHLEASELLAEAGDAPDERGELQAGVFRTSR
jgi:tetratricopeptide (TPR) repeat protein